MCGLVYISLFLFHSDVSKRGCQFLQLVMVSCLLLSVGRRISGKFCWGHTFEFWSTWLMLREALSTVGTLRRVLS